MVYSIDWYTDKTSIIYTLHDILHWVRPRNCRRVPEGSPVLADSHQDAIVETRTCTSCVEGHAYTTLIVYPDGWRVR